ncbi:PH domain-containing protein [Parvibacter caecicola]|uniref:PH domain-containing protein n=1 Tax=Parvibacter caecicola TaxID=747645 RepID=UPI00249A3D4A|nr:PH domain-containing protein [Parvibacter caecicola]
MEQPERYRVHHAFIWLGGLRALFVTLWVIIVGAFSGLAALVSEIMENPAFARDAAPVFALVVGGIIAVVLAIAVLCFLLRWVQWRHFWYQFDPAEFSIYSGVISKKRTHVPYGRVQSVDQKATLIQRLLGLCAVSIDTAGGANNKAIVVPYVTKSQAEALRQQLYVRKAQLAAGAAAPVAAADGAVASGEAAPGATAAPVMAGAAAVPMAAHPAAPSEGNILDAASDLTAQMTGVFDSPSFAQEAPSYEYGLSNKQMVLTGLFNNTSFVIVAVGLLAVVGQLIQGVADLVPNSDVLFESAVESAVAREGALMAGGILLGVFLVIALVMWALSAVGTMLSFGGFKARRRGDRVEVERGILQHSFQGVAIDRVQSVIISQTLVRRLMGYCEISLGKIDAMGDGSNESNKGKGGVQAGRVVVHPFVKKSQCAEIIAGLIPEFADMPTQATAVAPVAMRRAILRRTLWQGPGFWLIVATALLHVLMHVAAVATQDPDLFDLLTIFDPAATFLYAVGAVCMIANCIGAVMWARESSFAVNRRFMQVSNGGLSRESVSFPRQKIQFGCVRTNPFQRMAKTATLKAVIAAGVGGTTISLVDVTEEDAAHWMEWLEPRR